MAYNKDFENHLKRDKEFNNYLNSNWATINSIRGKITFNKAMFVGCAAIAGYSALNLAALAIYPQFSLVSFEGLKYGLIGGLSAKAGYGFFKKMKAEKEEAYTKKK